MGTSTEVRRGHYFFVVPLKEALGVAEGLLCCVQGMDVASRSCHGEMGQIEQKGKADNYSQ